MLNLLYVFLLLIYSIPSVKLDDVSAFLFKLFLKNCVYSFGMIFRQFIYISLFEGKNYYPHSLFLFCNMFHVLRIILTVLSPSPFTALFTFRELIFAVHFFISRSGDLEV